MAAASRKNQASAPTTNPSTPENNDSSLSALISIAKRSRDSTAFDFLRLPSDLQSLVLVAPTVDTLEPTSTRHEQPQPGTLYNVLTTPTSACSLPRRAASRGHSGAWLGCLERVRAKRVCRAFARLLGDRQDEQVNWIHQLRSTNARYSAANCYDRGLRLAPEFRHPATSVHLPKEDRRALVTQLSQLPDSLLCGFTSERVLVLFAFGVIPIAFVATLPSPIHAKLFLVNNSLTVMEHAWPVLSAPTRSAQQAPWRVYESFDASFFEPFVREHQRPHLELSRALWRVVDRCVASLAGEGNGEETSPLLRAAPALPVAAGRNVLAGSCGSSSGIRLCESQLLVAFESSVAAAAVSAAQEADANAFAKQQKLNGAVKKNEEAAKTAAARSSAGAARGSTPASSTPGATVDSSPPRERFHQSAAATRQAMFDKVRAIWGLESMKDRGNAVVPMKRRLRPACKPSVDCPICHLKWVPEGTCPSDSTCNEVGKDPRDLEENKGSSSGGDNSSSSYNNSNNNDNNTTTTSSSNSSSRETSDREGKRRGCLQRRLYAEYPFACPSYVRLPASSRAVGYAETQSSISASPRPLSGATAATPTPSSSSSSSASSLQPHSCKSGMQYDNDDDEAEGFSTGSTTDVYAAANSIATAAADYADGRRRADLLAAHAASLGSLATPSNPANATDTTAPATATASAAAVASTTTSATTTATAAAAAATSHAPLPNSQRVAQSQDSPRTIRDPNIIRLATARYQAAREACKIDPDDLSLGLIAVTKDGLSLQHLSPSLRANPLIVMAALHSNGSALKHAAFALQCDPVIVSTAIARDGAALQFVQCPNLRANRDLVSQAVRRDSSALAYAAPELKQERSIVVKAVRAFASSLVHAHESLKQDLEVLLVALPHDYTYLSHVPPAALRDYAFLKRALTLNGLCLELVPHPANRQPDLLLAAVQSKGAAYAHVPVDLRGDPQLVLAAVASNPAHLLLAPHALRGHRAFLSHLLTVCPLALAYTWPSIRADRGFVELAARGNIAALAGVYVPLVPVLSLLKDKFRSGGNSNSTSSTSTSSSSNSISSISSCSSSSSSNSNSSSNEEGRRRSLTTMTTRLPGLRSDRKFMLHLIEHVSPKAFQYCGDRLQCDREMVLAAVRVDEEALKCAPPSLRADPFIVRAALGLTNASSSSSSLEAADRGTGGGAGSSALSGVGGGNGCDEGGSGGGNGSSSDNDDDVRRGVGSERRLWQHQHSSAVFLKRRRRGGQGWRKQWEVPSSPPLPSAVHRGRLKGAKRNVKALPSQNNSSATSADASSFLGDTTSMPAKRATISKLSSASSSSSSSHDFTATANEESISCSLERAHLNSASSSHETGCSTELGAAAASRNATPTTPSTPPIARTPSTTTTSTTAAAPSKRKRQQQPQQQQLPWRPLLNVSCLAHCDSSLLNDRTFMQGVIARDGAALRYASLPLRSDRNLVLEALCTSGIVLGEVPDTASCHLRADKEVVEAAVRTFPKSFKFAALSLRADVHFVQHLVELVGSSAAPQLLECASDEVRRKLGEVKEATST